MTAKKKAFTLVELLLYVAITSTMLLTIVVFLATLLEVRVKNQSMAEVDQQGIQVTQIISQTIRNAEAVILPVGGATSSSLVLDVLNASLDPTIFDLASGTLRIKEGAGSYAALTNSLVFVSNLTFLNLSDVGQPGNIRYSFTLTRVNPANKNEFSYTKNFSGSASLR